jgi:hypothetical protein
VFGQMNVKRLKAMVIDDWYSVPVLSCLVHLYVMSITGEIVDIIVNGMVERLSCFTERNL